MKLKSAFLKLICIAAAGLICLSAAGCSSSGGDEVSGSEVSAADVSETDADIPDDADEPVDTSGSGSAPSFTAVAKSWDAAESDEAYMEAAGQRLNEYTELLIELSEHSDEISGRCDTAEDITEDEAYMPISAALIQWSRNVEGYPADTLGEQAVSVHSRLAELAGLTQDYIKAYPELLASDNAKAQGEHLNGIMDLVIELDALL